MFIPVQDENLPKAREDITGEIEEFLSLGVCCAEYILPEGRSSAHFRASFANSIKKNNFPVKVVKRGDRLFFIREA